MSAIQGICHLFQNIPQCRGMDDWHHRLFLTTNEKHAVACEKLTRQPITGNTLIGTSGLFLLNIAAQRGINAGTNPETIEHIILIDCSIRTEHFWTHMGEIITGSSHREEAIEKIRALVEENARFYFNGITENAGEELQSREDLHTKTAELVFRKFQSEIDSGSSCFSDDGSFAKIKKIFDNQSFVFLRMDLADDNAMQLLANRMEVNQWSTDLIYVSNVAEYIDLKSTPESLDSARKGYVSSLDMLSRKGTLFLQSVPRKCKDCTPLTLSLTRKSVRPLSVSDIFPYPEPIGTCKTCKFKKMFQSLPRSEFIELLRITSHEDLLKMVPFMEQKHILLLLREKPFGEVMLLTKELPDHGGKILEAVNTLFYNSTDALSSSYCAETTSSQTN